MAPLGRPSQNLSSQGLEKLENLSSNDFAAMPKHGSALYLFSWVRLLYRNPWKMRIRGDHTKPAESAAKLKDTLVPLDSLGKQWVVHQLNIS